MVDKRIGPNDRKAAAICAQFFADCADRRARISELFPAAAWSRSGRSTPEAKLARDLHRRSGGSGNPVDLLREAAEYERLLADREHWQKKLGPPIVDTVTDLATGYGESIEALQWWVKQPGDDAAIQGARDLVQRIAQKIKVSADRRLDRHLLEYSPAPHAAEVQLPPIPRKLFLYLSKHNPANVRDVLKHLWNLRAVNRRNKGRLSRHLSTINVKTEFQVSLRDDQILME